MKVYFFQPESSSRDLEKGCAAIVDALKKAGVTVLTNREPFPPAIEEKLADNTTQPMDLVDALIIEGSEPHSETGYLLAYAMTQKKPLLHLTLKGKARNNPLETFGKQHRVPSSIMMAHYDTATAEKVLMSFFGRLDGLVLPEVPNIKFTLRITPSIERYLEWKTQNTDLSKADFLRKLLQEEVIARDETYQRKKKRERGAGE